MTREEATEWLIQTKDKYIHDGDEQFDAKRKEALNMAIEALHSTDTHECELIERAEAQVAIMFAARRYTVAHEAHGVGHVVWSDELISVNDAMQSLRDVQTYVSYGNSERLRPKGEWIVDEGQQVLMQDAIADGEDWKVCSVCGCGFMVGHKYNTDTAYHKTFHNFCPNCGAYMRGGAR